MADVQPLTDESLRDVRDWRFRAFVTTTQVFDGKGREVSHHEIAGTWCRALARIDRDAALLKRCLRILATYDPDERIDGFWYPDGEPPPGVRNLRQLIADLKAAGVSEEKV